MDNRMNRIKKIAMNLSSYENMVKTLNRPDNAQIIDKKVLSIYEEVTLSHGLPAICMLYSELSFFFPDEGWDLKAHIYLEKIREKIECGQVYDLSMFSGYAGIGLAVDCLSQNGVRYKNFSNYVNSYIKETITGFLSQLYESQYCYMRDYDVISGVSGILGYTVLQEDLTEVSKELGSYLIYRCRKMEYGNIVIPGFYIPQNNQFLADDKKKFGNGNFNMGLSHGVPGILLALCLLKEKGIEVEGLCEAIKVCADFLYDFIDMDKMRWGAYLDLEDYCNNISGELHTRDAWCYGSPGVSYALYIGGMVLGEEKYTKLSVEVMENVMKDLQSIESPTFCHGLSGVSYIFWRFYELTGKTKFKESTECMIDEIWGFYKAEYTFGYKDIEYNSCTEQVGLLSGVPGILLPLMAMGGTRYTRWDYAFMLGDLKRLK